MNIENIVTVVVLAYTGVAFIVWVFAAWNAIQFNLLTIRVRKRVNEISPGTFPSVLVPSRKFMSAALATKAISFNPFAWSLSWEKMQNLLLTTVDPSALSDGSVEILLSRAQKSYKRFLTAGIVFVLMIAIPFFLTFLTK